MISAWGVFVQDCYGLPEDVMHNMLLKTFEDYKDALEYAQKMGEKTAIHLVFWRKDHVTASFHKENSSEVKPHE